MLRLVTPELQAPLQPQKSRREHLVLRSVHSSPFGVSRIAGIFADAFSEYPLVRWALTEQREHAEMRFQLFRLLMEEFGFSSGNVDLIEHDIGAAVWMRSENIPKINLETCDEIVTRLRETLGKRSTKKLLAISRAMKRHHPHKPHLYLYLIGVRKDVQRHQVGTQLMNTGLEAADREQLPVFLETSSEGAARFYRRFGFTVVDKYYVAVESPATWVMMRRPRP